MSMPAVGGHIPVLLAEVLEGLQPQPGRCYIDGTLGLAGHASAILQAGAPTARLLGLDLDPHALMLARARLTEFGERAQFCQTSYANLAQAAGALGWSAADGILLDLGVSSLQLDSPERGFAWRSTGALDMRFDPSQPLTAAQVVNTWGEVEIANLLFEYGEEHYSRAIARAIVQARPLASTTELATVIAKAVGHKPGYRQAEIHPATRSFQALRIAVNRELETVRLGIQAAIDFLAPSGRLAVISFHSLEDRIAKTVLRQAAQDCICPPELLLCVCDHRRSVRLLHNKPILPSATEVANNPRSRSAKLRVVEKMDTIR